MHTDSAGWKSGLRPDRGHHARFGAGSRGVLGAAYSAGIEGDGMDIYDELGVRKVINGSATLTMLGGSLMPPEVLAAMADAAGHFVDIDELQEKVGQRIAE